MSETPAGIETSNFHSELETNKVIQDLDSAATTIQSLLDHQESIPIETIDSIPSILTDAHETLLKADILLHQYETKLQEAKDLTDSANELQTLLDVLPVGIIVGHDPQNQTMTINPAGMKMLNLTPGMSPFKAAPGGEELPFKILRNGEDIPIDELPILYASTHKVTLRDVELVVQHSDGKLLNLLAYASPLLDEQGVVRGTLGVLVDITGRMSSEQRLVMQYTIARVLAESNNINQAAEKVLQLICETARWEYGALWRVDPETLTMTNEGVWHVDDIHLSEYAEAVRYSVFTGEDNSLPGHVLHSGQPLWLSNLTDFQSPDVIEAEKAGLRCAFILPVHSRNSVIALLECFSVRSQTHDQKLTAMLSAVGNQIGIFLERKQLEEALAIRANQLRLLAQADIALSTTLDYKKRLETLVHIIVPDLADWCAIDIIDQNNSLKRVAVAHFDPEKEKQVYEIQPTRAIDFKQANTPQIETLHSGQSLLYTDIPSSLIEKTVVDAQQLEIIRELDPISAIVVPLTTPDHVLGICTFVQSDSGRRYSSADLELAEDLGRRVSLSLDNAFLYAESQKLNTELEQRVDEKTFQLRSAINQLTNQIEERRHADEEVRRLNAELEQRIAERTSQLENANRVLKKEVVNHQRASQALRILLKRTRELYRISQSIGSVRTPYELLKLLLSSSYLRDVSRASIAILDKPWIENETPPEQCFILAEWNKGSRQPRFIDQRFTLEEYGVMTSEPFGEPMVIPDIQAVSELSDTIKKRFSDLQTHGLIILPLIASGEWYGLLSLHYKTPRMPDMDDLRHVRGIVDETAIVIKNVRLLEMESQARQEAERANDLKLKFLGMISHELRTPLTSIKGFATTLLAEDVTWPADKQREFLETINEESDKLHDLIEQLLDLSRIEAGILRIAPAKMSLNDLFDSILAQLKTLSTDHKLKLTVPTDLPPILGDEQRIAQVITNLVSNAVKFSPAETLITIEAHQTGQMVQVDVADQGPGVPLKYKARVFEAFRQLDDGTGSQAKGAGLGLAICKGLIEAHRGQIWIQNQPDTGTVVSFTIPIYSE